MSEQSQFQPLSAFEIRDFIVTKLGYNKEKGYKKVLVSYNVEGNCYNVKLVHESKFLFFSTAKTVRFHHYDDHFSFEGKGEGDEYQTKWLQMQIERSLNGRTTNKLYKSSARTLSKIRKFLKEKDIVFLENWCFVRNVKKNASSAEFVTINIEEAVQLIAQGEKLKIIAMAYGFGSSSSYVKMITPVIHEIIGVKVRDFHNMEYILGKARVEVEREIRF